MLGKLNPGNIPRRMFIMFVPDVFYAYVPSDDIPVKSEKKYAVRVVLNAPISISLL